MICVSASAQKPIRIYSTYAENYAATQLHDFLEKGGCKTTFGGKNTGHTIYVGLAHNERQRYKAVLDSLQPDGYAIIGDGRNVHLFGKGEKGTLYAVYAFLEKLGYRLYTPEAMLIPDLSKGFHLSPFTFHLVENPAFEYREVLYYYPNHSQLYADWHHLHTQADRERIYGMYVHTFSKLLPPDIYFDAHPEWYSLNNGRRSRDGQLCLSNPALLKELCKRLRDTMSCRPEPMVWSVSPNDNYNACECENCKRLDSLYGGQSGMLLWFVNQVARRFPDKTISTLAYQYTRKAPTSGIKPEPNVQIMLCPIESGRQAPIPQTDPAFRKDMEDWAQLTDNIYLWDYVVQFRNFWNPFPNLHVLQPNLQYFRDNGVRMMFEQATGANNVTSWMDIRCYMIAKLLWNPDTNIDSIMADFYQGYYGEAGKHVKEIIDTMTAALIVSGQTLNIYGYPVDGCITSGYLWPSKIEYYHHLMRQAYEVTRDSVIHERLRFFKMALDFASIELKANDMYGDFEAEDMTAMVDSLTTNLTHFGVKIMMEMGISPDVYSAQIHHWCDKTFSRAEAWEKPVTLRHPATAPYNTAGLTDGEAGILDYRHRWLGFWGDTLDAVIDLGEPTEIHEVSLDLYFYPLSWIFLPEWIQFQTSNDGAHWEPWGFIHPDNHESLAVPDIYTYKQAPTHSHIARYVRVVAAPLPEIPAWHRAAGQKPWIFTDEIIVK